MTTFAERSATRPLPPGSAAPAVLPGRGAHPGLVLGVIAAGALATIALWWHDTTSVNGLGDWLTNAGRITGLLAGYAVVVLVALMARIPPLERGIGADRLARWHALGGRYTVSFVVAHALLITWGYAVTAHTGIVHQTSTLLLSYPDVLMASVAGLLLVGVGVTSARAARRRLRYETWYYLHLYTYLAVALAFSHQFASGAEFIDNRAARVVWSTMYAVVGAAILWYRVAVPIRQSVRHRMRVAAVYPEGPGVVSLVITGRHLDALRAESGQFFRWRFLTKRTVVGVQPVLAVGAAAAGPAAHHREGPRLAQRVAGRRAAGHPRLRRGPLRRDDRGAAHPAQGAAHRRRHRHHAAAGAVPVAGRLARRT